MIRGFMKTSSRTALIAAAGLLMSTYAYAPANAADLGASSCCSDLEERVAELEATTARKGNRVVSLQIYGQVNKALMIWDDGVDSDAFVVDNVLASSRFGLQGKATMMTGMTAGYNIEYEIQDARSDQVYNGTWDGIGTGGPKSGDDGFLASNTYDGALLLRQNYVYIESDRLGRVSIGHQSSGADGAYEVNLSGSLRTADPLNGNAFFIRDTGANRNNGQLINWARDLDGPRDDVIRYDTPSLYGFILSASWGENDYADLVLRFKKEFNSIRVAAALAYQWDSRLGWTDVSPYDDSSAPPSTPLGTYNLNFETFGGSISMMHIPTGLYFAFAAASSNFGNLHADPEGEDGPDMADPSFWYLQAGVERKWLPYGATTIYGEYGQYSDFAVLYVPNATSTEANRWGLGLNQKIDTAAMDIYANATFWSFDHNSPTELEQKDLSTILLGSRIQF